jgi:hypothetical protein
MVDNLSKITPSIPSTKKVKRVGSEQRNNQQKPFEEALKDKEKKKNRKKDSKHKKISAGGSAFSRKKMSFHADKPTTEKSKRNVTGSSEKTIDIRV